MKIVVCSSLSFANEVGELKVDLEQLGHEVIIPTAIGEILIGETSLADINKLKENDCLFERSIATDAIRRHYKLMMNADVALIANYKKKGIAGYVGGNTFLEMGFAHILEMPIYILNPIPELSYADEMRAMAPVVIRGDLSSI